MLECVEMVLEGLGGCLLPVSYLGTAYPFLPFIFYGLGQLL